MNSRGEAGLGANVYIGGQNPGEPRTQFNGMIDDVYFYRGVLTEAEIRVIAGLITPDPQNVFINELMASNGMTFTDEDGDFEDWIELYNADTVPINLTGWGISDDPGRPFRWVFPDVTIGPNSHLLIWASGKDRSPTQGERVEGRILREVYRDIYGGAVSDLINHPSFPDEPTSRNIVTDYFEAPRNIADHYGQRIHGYILPPMSGDYTFWISGDNGSALYLGTHPNIDYNDPIAAIPDNRWSDPRQWDRFPEQQSFPIYLEQGQLYYICALMKEDIGGDHLAVRWQLPNGIVEEPIPASCIYAELAELHTNFSISADGEVLQLTTPDGTTVDSVGPVSLLRDVSYGRSVDGGQDWVFFTTPTPGETNDYATGYEGIMLPPSYSRKSGFYEDPFNLDLMTTQQEATIHYTLDGSEPSDFSPVYSKPLFIDDRAGQPNTISMIPTADSWLVPQGEVFKGTVVRARVFRDNYIPSQIKTHSFFVGPDIKHRYELPVISLATASENFFDPIFGIYVPDNFWGRGLEWERPVHITFFETDGTVALSQDAGVRIHGGAMRALPQKSLRLYARAGYGQREFDCPFFPGYPFDQFRRLILRASGNDNSQTMFRDAMIQQVVGHLRFDTQAYRPLIVFLNGEYWGIHNLRERYDKYYLEQIYGVDPDEVDILTFPQGNHLEVKEGRADHYVETINYIETHGLSDPEHYAHIKTRIDIDNFIDYNVAQIYANNRDWPGNNHDWWRKRTNDYEPDAPYGHDGRWRWLLYDTDFGFGLNGGPDINTMEHATSPDSTTWWNQPWTTFLLRKMLENNSFKNDFINRFADQLNTAFLPERVIGVIDQMQATIAPEMDEHIRRWRRPESYSSWIGHVNVLRNFAYQRPAYVREHLRSHFHLGVDRQLSVDVSGCEKSFLRINQTDINAAVTPGVDATSPYPWSGFYFDGVPITVTAIAEPGFRFSHWTADEPLGIDPFVDTLSLSLSSNLSLTAHFEPLPLLHYWHFNELTDETVYIVSADHTFLGNALITYLGTGEGYMDTTEGSEINTRLSQEAGNCLRVRNPSDTRELLLRLPTTGYKDIRLSYAVRRTPNGAQAQTIEYRSDITSDWHLFDEITVSEDYELFMFDFADIPEVNNNPEFEVRILFGGSNASGTSGNNRFDNIVLEAVALPGTNRPPILLAPLKNRQLIEEIPATVNLASYFADPDGDEMTYFVKVDKPFVVEPVISGDMLTLTPLYRGDAVITVSADDGHNAPLEISFRVLVYPKAHKLREGEFIFDYWSSEQTEHTFPEHMLFIQSDVSDPGLYTPLEYAYFIPHVGNDSYHANDQDKIGFPYMTTGRSRINGLDEDGISFINTGRDRDLGGALLALDTRSVEAVDLSWLCQTLLRNDRRYAIRLQYRVGYTGPFLDVFDDEGNPIEYLVEDNGHKQTFGTLRLPDAVAGCPYVQLLWRYYHVDGTSGSRAQLRLDEISVTMPSFPYGNQPHEIPSRIQAEEFDVGGQGVAYYDATFGNSGGAFRRHVDVDIISIIDGFAGYAITDIKDGEWLSYTVNSLSAETEVYARVASTELGDQILVWLDNELLATMDVPNTGSLTTWQTISTSCLFLPDREDAKLMLEFVGTGFRLNWIDFQNRKPYLSIPHKIPGRIQLENYDIGGQHISYFDNTAHNTFGHYRSDFVDILFSQDTDGKFAVYGTNGEWLEYTCNILPGIYTVIVRNSCPITSQELTLSLEGQTLATFELSVTGGWYNWQNTAVAEVSLPGGSHVLRFTLSGSGTLLNFVDFIRHRNIADITQSGQVDLGDFAMIAGQWLGAPDTLPSADIAPLGGDGVVDLLDLLILAENWLAE